MLFILFSFNFECILYFVVRILNRNLKIYDRRFIYIICCYLQLVLYASLLSNPSEKI